MKKSIISLVTAAALSGTFAIGASAATDEVTVKKGDTLWDIAQKHNISVNELKEWNNISSNLIKPDEKLKVALTEQYHIQKGDTLSEIALNYEGISWKTLQQWNSIENADLIYAGDMLTVYLKGGPSPSKYSTSVVEQEKQEEKKEVVEEVKTEEKKEQSTSDNANKEETSSENKEVVEEKQTEDSNTNNNDSTSASAESPDKEVAQELTMTATAYTATCEGCTGITSTGINLLENPDMKVISVDPSVIPLGSKVYVEGYGEAIAGDTGGAIVGNKIDIFIPDLEDAINWGVKEVKVKVYK